MKYKALIIGALVVAPLIVGTTVLAQAKDDWQLFICAHNTDDQRCTDRVDVYVKEWKPRKGVTCWVANAEGLQMDHRAGNNVSISCIKD